MRGSVGYLTHRTSGPIGFPAQTTLHHDRIDWERAYWGRACQDGADWRFVDCAHRRWTIGWDWRGISFASTRARYRLNAAGKVDRIEQRRAGFRVLASVIIVLVFAIGLARLAASEVPERKALQYQASILIPPARPLSIAAPSVIAQPAPQAVLRHTAVAHHPAPRRHASHAMARRDPVANGSADQAITAAARTGETQSWDEPGGARGFAVAGPAEIAGTETCRSIAILIRQGDGRSHVSNRRRCTE